MRDAYFDKVESIKERSLFEVFEEHNQGQEKLIGNGVSKATYWVSVYIIRLLREFVQQKYKREDLYLRELNLNFIQSFHSFLRIDKGMAQNSSTKHLKLLRKIINFDTPLPRLERAKDMFLFGYFTGLRISDILSLRWKQILGTDEFTVIEQKTGKIRTIRLNRQLQEHIKECYEHINPVGINAPILISQKGTIFTVQRINTILKEVKKKYRLKIKNFSCHSLSLNNS